MKTADVCKKRAVSYKQLIENLMKMVSRETIHEENKLDIQEMMKELKIRLGEDVRIFNSSKRMSKMSDIEYDYYRAVYEVSTRISSRYNTHPIKSDWYDQLYQCHIDIEQYLHNGYGINKGS